MTAWYWISACRMASAAACGRILPDRGLDPLTEGQIVRAEEERGGAEVGEGYPRAARHAVIGLPLEEPCVAGTDLQGLGSHSARRGRSSSYGRPTEG